LKDFLDCGFINPQSLFFWVSKMTKQHLIDEINNLLINNDIAFLRVKSSTVKIIDLNAILNFFKKKIYWYTPLVSMLFTIHEYSVFFRMKTRADEK